MSSSGQITLEEIWAMLDHCAPGWTKKDRDHNTAIKARLATRMTFAGLRCGAVCFAAPPPSRPLARAVARPFACAGGYPTPPLQNRVVRIASASPAA